MTEAIEGTPPQASAPKAPAVESTTATEAAPSEATNAEATRAEDIHLESTIADIDKILLNMATDVSQPTSDRGQLSTLQSNPSYLAAALPPQVFLLVPVSVDRNQLRDSNEGSSKRSSGAHNWL